MMGVEFYATSLGCLNYMVVIVLITHMDSNKENQVIHHNHFGTREPRMATILYHM
jgi:hypothetical protein